MYTKKFTIKNDGDIGAENITVLVALEGEEIYLNLSPKITTFPNDLKNFVNLKKEKKSTNKLHYWNVSLLNPGETLSFEYMVASNLNLESVSLNVMARKKDWHVVDQHKEKEKQKETAKVWAEWIIAGLFILLILQFVILGIEKFNILKKGIQRIKLLTRN